MIVKIGVLLVVALSDGLGQSQGLQGLVGPEGDRRLAEIICLVEPRARLDQKTYQSAIP